jgi:hypothetical protein
MKETIKLSPRGERCVTEYKNNIINLEIISVIKIF